MNVQSIIALVLLGTHLVAPAPLVSKVRSPLILSKHAPSRRASVDLVRRSREPKHTTKIRRAAPNVQSAINPASGIEQPKSTSKKTVVGLTSFLAADTILKIAFEKASVTSFPSSLAGMIIAFTSLQGVRMFRPVAAAKIVAFMGPAVALLKVWLPLFFVPPLVVLPLKYSLVFDIAGRLAVLVASGFIFTLLSTAFVSNLLPGPPAKDLDTMVTTAEKEQAPNPGLPDPRKPLTVASTLLVLNLLLHDKVGEIGGQTILQRMFGVSSTATAYLLGTRLPAAIRSVFHPVLACATIASVLQFVLSVVTGSSYTETLAKYFGGGYVGAGDIISRMLGPVIISFGFQLYVFREVLMSNFLRVLGTTLFAAAASLLSSAKLASMLKLMPVEAALTPLTRSVTSPLALAGAEITGADPSLSAFLVAITGVLGAALGRTLLERFKITNDVTAGLAIGASAHGLGAASVSNQPVKFSAAALSMTLTGLWTVLILAVPLARDFLIRMATS